MQLSIIIPVYNVEKYFRECLLSVIALQNICYEVIIVHDALLDHSLDGVKDIISQHTNIFVLDRKNAGLAVARNEGLEAAKGDYIYFLDSDDKIDTHQFECIFYEGVTYQADIIVGGYLLWNGKTNMKDIMTLKTDEACVCTGTYYLTYIYPHDIAVVWKGIYSRSLFQKYPLNFSRLKYFEDEDWTPRIFSYAQTVYYTKAIFYLYRLREGSLSNDKFTKHKFEDMMKVSANLLAWGKNNRNTSQKVTFDSLAFRCLLAIACRMKDVKLAKEEYKLFQRRLREIQTVWMKYKALWCVSRVSCSTFILFTRLIFKLKNI